MKEADRIAEKENLSPLDKAILTKNLYYLNNKLLIETLIRVKKHCQWAIENIDKELERNYEATK
jgi:hypothetical protein